MLTADEEDEITDNSGVASVAVTECQLSRQMKRMGIIARY